MINNIYDYLNIVNAVRAEFCHVVVVGITLVFRLPTFCRKRGLSILGFSPILVRTGRAKGSIYEKNLGR